MNSFFRTVLLLLAIAAFPSFAQIGLGGAVSIAQRSGSVNGSEQRLTPFLYGQIPMVGALRLEWAPSALVLSGDDTDDSREINRYGAHLAVNGGNLLGNSYVLLSWNQVNVYDDGLAGDSKWNEWGLGFGATWSVSPQVSLFVEMEHIWSTDEQENLPTETIDIDRRGWQLQLGFVAVLFLGLLS